METTGGGQSTGSGRKWGKAALVSRQSFAPYLGLHPFLSLKKGAQEERERGRGGGYYEGEVPGPRIRRGTQQA